MAMSQGLREESLELYVNDVAFNLAVETFRRWLRQKTIDPYRLLLAAQLAIDEHGDRPDATRVNGDETA